MQKRKKKKRKYKKQEAIKVLRVHISTKKGKFKSSYMTKKNTQPELKKKTKAWDQPTKSLLKELQE